MPMAAAALPVLAEAPATAMQQAEVGRPQQPKEKEPQPEPTIATAAATPAPEAAMSDPASTVATEGPATATTCNTPWLVELVKNDVSTSLGISFEHPRLLSFHLAFCFLAVGRPGKIPGLPIGFESP